MSELFCEEIAHKAGFIVSVGNWITPDGSLITGDNYETHHWETLKQHLGNPETDNHLSLMNQCVDSGYIRLVFRNDVLFQVKCKSKEEIWGDDPGITTMRNILEKLPDVEMHIFSKNFYMIGVSQNILNKNIPALQIQES